MAESASSIGTLYRNWYTHRTPFHTKRLLNKLQPTMNSIMMTYTGGADSPLIRGRAKALALKAIESYDPSRKVALQTHMFHQLRPLTRYNMQASNPIKISERQLSAIREMNDAENFLSESLGRLPSDNELADRLNWSIKKITKTRRMSNPIISTTSEEEHEDPAISRVDPMQIWMDYVYHDLSPIDQQIFDWKLGRHGRVSISNNEIARMLNISPAAVTQRAAKIQAKILEGYEVSG